MRFALVNLELPINRTAEAIVRNHSTHRALDQQFRMANPTRPDVFRFVTADITGEAHEALLFFLLAGHANLAGVNDDNEIAGIDVRSENSLLFSAQKVCRFDRDATEHLIFGIDQPPFAVNFVSFSGKRLHQRRGKGTEATGHERHCQPEESSMKQALRCFMEIIMRLAILAASLFFPLSFGHAKDKSARAENEPVSAASVIRELNLARENPKLYATFVAESRPFHMIERGKAVDEAVRFLQKAHPLPALTLSPGMSRAAADHCAEQVERQLGYEAKPWRRSDQSLRKLERDLGREYFLQPKNCARGRLSADYRRWHQRPGPSQKHFQSEVQLCRRRIRSTCALSHGLHDRLRRRLRGTFATRREKPVTIFRSINYRGGSVAESCSGSAGSSDRL